MTRNLATFFLVALLSLNVARVAPAAILFFEDFEGLALGPNVDEGLAGDNVWTKEAPSGWTIDDSGVFGIDDPAIGMTEWKGWSFTDRDWWAQMAGDQRRTEFVLGTGTIAVADPDEWDDRGNPEALGTILLSLRLRRFL